MSAVAAYNASLVGMERDAKSPNSTFPDSWSLMSSGKQYH